MSNNSFSNSYKTCNVVARVELNSKPSFAEISSHVPSARKTADSNVYIRYGGGTLYKVGSKVCSISGARNLLEILYYNMVYLNILRNSSTKKKEINSHGKVSKITKRKRTDLKCTQVVINNIVAHSELKHNLDVAMFYVLNSKRTGYNPTVFPGCIYSGAHKQKTILYESGNIILTGVKSIEDCDKLFRDARLKVFISELLSSCKSSFNENETKNFITRIHEYYNIKSTQFISISDIENTLKQSDLPIEIINRLLNLVKVEILNTSLFLKPKKNV